MASDINDGGFAFPGDFTDVAIFKALRGELGTHAALTQAKVNSPGMSVRTYAAIQIMAGMPFDSAARDLGLYARADAVFSVERADALLYILGGGEL